MAIGEPLSVPREADEKALEEWRAKLQAALADCKAKCAALLSD
jgi:hypothetical protein